MKRQEAVEIINDEMSRAMSACAQMIQLAGSNIISRLEQSGAIDDPQSKQPIPMKGGKTG